MDIDIMTIVKYGRGVYTYIGYVFRIIEDTLTVLIIGTDDPAGIGMDLVPADCVDTMREDEVTWED